MRIMTRTPSHEQQHTHAVLTPPTEGPLFATLDDTDAQTLVRQQLDQVAAHLHDVRPDCVMTDTARFTTAVYVAVTAGAMRPLLAELPFLEDLPDGITRGEYADHITQDAALAALTAHIPTLDTDDRDRLRHYATSWLAADTAPAALRQQTRTHAQANLLHLLGCDSGPAARHWSTLAEAARIASGGSTAPAMTALATAVLHQVDAPVRALIEAADTSGHPDLIALLHVAGAEVTV